MQIKICNTKILQFMYLVDCSKKTVNSNDRLLIYRKMKIMLLLLLLLLLFRVWWRLCCQLCLYRTEILISEPTKNRLIAREETCDSLVVKVPKTSSQYITAENRIRFTNGQIPLLFSFLCRISTKTNLVFFWSFPFIDRFYFQPVIETGISIYIWGLLNSTGTWNSP